jgi:hypothetical protein
MVVGDQRVYRSCLARHGRHLDSGESALPQDLPSCVPF